MDIVRYTFTVINFLSAQVFSRCHRIIPDRDLWMAITLPIQIKVCSHRPKANNFCGPRYFNGTKLNTFSNFVPSRFFINHNHPHIIFRFSVKFSDISGGIWSYECGKKCCRWNLWNFNNRKLSESQIIGILGLL